MPKKRMRIDEFIKTVCDEAFLFLGEKLLAPHNFSPIENSVKEEMGDSFCAFVTDNIPNVPPDFVLTLEVDHDPKAVVRDTYRRLTSVAVQCVLLIPKGKFNAEGFMRSAVIQGVQQVFNCVTQGMLFTPLAEDVIKLYGFYNEKIVRQQIVDELKEVEEEGVASSEEASSGDESNENVSAQPEIDSKGASKTIRPVELREEEFQMLIHDFQRSVFSIAAFLSRITKEGKVVNTGVYL